MCENCGCVYRVLRQTIDRQLDRCDVEVNQGVGALAGYCRSCEMEQQQGSRAQKS